MWEVCQQWQWPSSHDPVPEADRDVKQGHYSVSQSCTGNITCIVIYILLLVVTCIFPGNKKKRLLLFFVLVILIDIQNICSINSRALAVGLMAYGHIGSQFIRLHINMDSLKCTSFLWSLQRHRSCVRPLIPPVDWGRGYKTIVVLRLFDYSPLLTRKIAVDKQENSERAVTFPLLKNT